jgi:hypothetical protein
MASWRWLVDGAEDRYGQRKGFSAEGVVDAECGEEALHQLLGQVPGPWDELDTGEKFTITLEPVA